MAENLQYAVRGSDGFRIVRGLAEPEVVFEKKDADKTSRCRVFQFSNTGQYFCYCDSVRTVVIDCVTRKEILNEELPRTQQIEFSPKDRLLAICEPYVVYVSKTSQTDGKPPQPAPNLRLFALPAGSHYITMVAQKQNSWKIQWTDDEVYSARLVGSEIFIHKYNNYTKYESKLVVPSAESCALSSGMEPHHLAVYVPPLKGQPAFVQLRRLDHVFTVVASKTFFKCDKANLIWNCKGSALIVIAIVDVDKSNKSYYGEQNLYLIAINGESCMVSLDKTGPIYSVKWNPNGKHFVVCHGYMPAMVSMFNTKGEMVFNFGEGSRNDIYFNRFGNIVILCGFGNIASGRMEFWDLETNKLIVQMEAPHTTLLEWAPDGQHLMTATTTPRLRIDNGYKIWHYTGRLVHQYPYDNSLELWEVLWRPVDGVYNSFKAGALTGQERTQAASSQQQNTNVATIHPVNKLPMGAISASAAYVPPHLRKGGAKSGSGCLVGGPKPAPAAPSVSTEEKKIRGVQKKLDEIEKLKARRDQGDALEANQLAKIEREKGLIATMSQLKVSMQKN